MKGEDNSFLTFGSIGRPPQWPAHPAAQRSQQIDQESSKWYHALSIWCRYEEQESSEEFHL